MLRPILTTALSMTVGMVNAADWNYEDNFLTYKTGETVAPLIHDAGYSQLGKPIYTINGEHFLAYAPNSLFSNYGNKFEVFGKVGCRGESRLFLSYEDNYLLHTLRKFPLVIAYTYKNDNVYFLKVHNIRTRIYAAQSYRTVGGGECHHHADPFRNTYAYEEVPFEQYSDIFELRYPPNGNPYPVLKDKNNGGFSTSKYAVNNEPVLISEPKELSLRMSASGQLTEAFTNQDETNDILISDFSVTKKAEGVFDINVSSVMSSNVPQENVTVLCSSTVGSSSRTGLYNIGCYQTNQPNIRISMRDNEGNPIQADVALNVKW